MTALPHEWSADAALVTADRRDMGRILAVSGVALEDDAACRRKLADAGFPADRINSSVEAARVIADEMRKADEGSL